MNTEKAFVYYKYFIHSFFWHIFSITIQETVKFVLRLDLIFSPMWCEKNSLETLLDHHKTKNLFLEENHQISPI